MTVICGNPRGSDISDLFALSHIDHVRSTRDVVEYDARQGSRDRRQCLFLVAHAGPMSSQYPSVFITSVKMKGGDRAKNY